MSKFHPKCHPERSKNPNLSSSSAAKDLDWDFCEVELLRNVVSVAKAGYGIEQKRGYSPKANERGISDGVPQCLLSPGCISYESHTAYFRMLLCESRRVINRPEIPSSVVRKTHFLVGFATFLVRSRTFHYAKLRLRPCQDPSRCIFRPSSLSAAKDLGEKCLLEDDGRGSAQDDTKREARPPVSS